MLTAYYLLITTAVAAWIAVISNFTRTPELRERHGRTLGLVGTGLGLAFGLFGLGAGLWFSLA